MSKIIPCKLPSFLAPQHEPAASSKFIRLGKKGDGGYIVDLNSVHAAEKLISFGINNEWSFEAAFYKQHPVPLAAFDHSISQRVFLRNFLIHSSFDFSPAQAYRDLLALLQYKIFFSNPHKHHRLHVGYNSITRMVSFEQALEIARATHQKIFLKIDTEQWEYRILEDLIHNAQRITGLVIEFHHVDLNLERIKDFIQRFPLPLVYTRANNYGHVSLEQLPLLIECTFSANAVPRLKPFTPEAMDMQNSRKLPPYELSFE